MMGEFKSFFKTVASGEGNRCKYPTRLDVYGCGCQHNCSYCYARSLLSFRGLWDEKSPKVADIRKIRGTIDKRLKRGDVVRLGGMTDCFMPIEKKTRNAYKTIEALNKAGVGYLIVTKSDLVAADEYLSIMDKRLAHVQISVTSTNDGLSRKIEPGAPVPSRRIKAIEKLYANGIDVATRLSPFIPEFIDVDVINAIECGKLQVEFLRVNGFIKNWLRDSGVDLSVYTHGEGGYRHLPLERKINLLARLGGNGKEVSVCEDVSEHYAYWERNVNPSSDCCNLRL